MKTAHVWGVFALVLLLSGVGAGWLVYQHNVERAKLAAQLAALQSEQKAEAERAKRIAEELEAKRLADATAQTAARERLQQQSALESEFDRRLVAVRDGRRRAEQLVTEANEKLRVFISQPSQNNFRSFDVAAGEFFKQADSLQDEFKAALAILVNPDMDNALRSRLDEAASSLRQPVSQIVTRASRGRELIAQIKSGTYEIASNQGWQSTGLEARKGERFVGVASGSWRWGTFTANWTGPEGERAGLTYRALEEFPNAALLARVGGGKISLGFGSWVVDRVGEVEFRINDTIVSDNQGSMKVQVWVFPQGLGE